MSCWCCWGRSRLARWDVGSIVANYKNKRSKSQHWFWWHQWCLLAYWIPDFWEAPLRVWEAVPCQEMRNIPNYEEIQKHDLVAGLELSWCLHFCYFWENIFQKGTVAGKHFELSFVQETPGYGEKRLELPSGWLNLSKDQSCRILWVLHGLTRIFSQKHPECVQDVDPFSLHDLYILYYFILITAITAHISLKLCSCFFLPRTWYHRHCGFNRSGECGLRMLGTFFHKPWDVHSYLLQLLLNCMN